MSLSNFEPKTILAQKYKMIFIKSVTNVTLLPLWSLERALKYNTAATAAICT